MSNIKIILFILILSCSLGGVLYVYQDQLFSLFDPSSLTTAGINNGINNQETTASDSTSKRPGGGLTGFPPSGKVLPVGAASSQGDIASENISDSPLLSLLWKRHQNSQITVRNGDFIIYDKEKLRIAKESVTSKKIADHTIQDEDIARNAITSRAIDDGTILGIDISHNADLVIRSLETTGGLTIGGTTSFSSNLDMQSNRILNIGNVGTNFTSTGGLDLAGNLDVNGTVSDIAGTLTLSSFSSNGGVLYTDAGGTINQTMTGTPAQFLVANASNIPTFVSMSGDVLITTAGISSIQTDSVALGTDTTGNYVATITGSGTITSSGATTGENINHTLSVTADSIGDTQLTFNTGQHLTTASTPTFAGLTITGGIANINAGSNFATNIGTGSSTGAVTIGGGLNTFALDSTNFDVSTAGALSGITGYTQTSGNVVLSGTGTFGTGTGAISLNGATSVTGTNTFTVGTGLTSLGGNLTVTGTSWTATPTISGLITATSGVTSNGTLTVGANQNATMVSGTGIFTQTYTGTGTAHAITANALTTGNILSLSSSSTTAGANNTGLNISIGGANTTPAITRYGLQSAVTATNATSGTNIAGYFTATGATTANYGVYSVATSNYFSGSVGIGTTSPSAMLSLYGTTNAMRFSYDATNYSTLSANSTGELQIKGASVYDASLTIGSNDANNTAIIFDNLTNDFYVGIDNEDSSKFKIGLLGQDAFMTILPTTGYIGIGTTSPSAMLSLYGTSNAMRLSYDATNYTTLATNSTGELQIKGASVYDASLTIGSNDANSTAIIFDNLTNDFYIGIDNEDSSKFKIGLNTQDAFMTILSTNGYVGIGTVSPTAMLQIGTATAGGNVKINNGYICVDSDGTCTGATTAGTVYAVNAYTTGADYAEYFYTKDTDLLPGEAVCIDSETENGVKRCQNNGDNNIMGIVSSHPSIVGNKNHPNDDHYKIIGMLGQVSGKVSNENGNIQVGDNLTAGLIPGQMRKASAGESTVGVALQNFSDANGSIQILISRRNQSLTVEKVEQAVTDNIAMMNIGDQVNTLVNKAKTALDTQIASQSDILTLQSQNIISLQNNIIALQSDSAVEKNKTALLQSQMDLVKAQSQTTIDFISTLDMSTLVYKDVLGNLDIGTGKFTAKDIEVKNITTDTLTMKDNRTSGKGIILVGQTEVTIDTPDVSENAKISLTAKGSSNGKILYFDEIVEGKSFKVKIDAPTIEKDINFIWLIIQ